MAYSPQFREVSGMLGSALYFPDIDIRDPTWLRSTLLFWDDIQTIAPSAIERPYRNEDTIICHEEGVLRPLRCDLHPSAIDELGQKILKITDQRSDFRFAIHGIKEKDSPTIDALSSVDGLSRDIDELVIDVIGMHPAKMSPEFREIVLRQIG